MQETALIILITIIVYLISKSVIKKKVVAAVPSAAVIKKILALEVPFYIDLDIEQKTEFEKRLQIFLEEIKITGVNTIVEDIDRVLVAASAIIPIFNFPSWQYLNLHEVLLYPSSFDHEFNQDGEGRNVLGMVGSGALNHVMILSQSELRQAFINKTGKDNTAIHEFVHLLDKSDGSIDGIPETVLHKKYVLPWLRLMQHEIQQIKNNLSDINPYGATNESEFFAVVSEYFFKRPDLLQKKHPELFALLEKIFCVPQKNEG